MKKILWSVSLILYLCCFPAQASAQLMLGETRIEREISPAATIVDSFTIYNLSDKEMHLKVFWQDFIYVPPFNGKKDFLPIGSTDYSMGDWIRFAPQQITLPARGEQKINYSIKVPSDIEGGYYGVLFFERVPKDYKQENIAMKIVTRIGCLFFLEAQNKEISAQILQLRTESQSIMGAIQNMGNVFLFPAGIYYILDTEGLVADRGELEKIYLIPDKQADFQIDIPEDISAGKYTMVLTFDLGEGKSAVKEIDFYKDDNSGIRILEIRD